MPAWDQIVLLQAVLFAGSTVDVVLFSVRVDRKVRYIGAWRACGCDDSCRHLVTLGVDPN